MGKGDHPSRYDPYWRQRVDEQKAAKLARVKEKLRDAAGKGPSRKKAQREPETSIAKVLSDRERKNSRTKGNRGELDVAKVFSKWCGEIVKRTPGSGGWGGAEEFGTTADLVCRKKAFPFHIEVKHREGWVLDDLVTGVRREHDKSIVQWWKQCTETCPKGKIPLLVFRRNHQPWLVLTQSELTTLRDNTVVTWITLDSLRRKVGIMTLSSFLESIEVPYGLKNHKDSVYP